MAKVFLDANILIDLIEKRAALPLEIFAEHNLFISPLSVHILFYVTKQKIPHDMLSEILKKISIATFDDALCSEALLGPTSDFEDNVQLHSAAQSDCQFFITRDKKLLAMKFFGKTKIVTNKEI